MSPGSLGEEVEEPGAEREEVGPIARVFHQHQFASRSEDPRNFLKELHASSMVPELVGGEYQKRGVELLVQSG
jgi:hypothetical protein